MMPTLMIEFLALITRYVQRHKIITHLHLLASHPDFVMTHSAPFRVP